MDNKEKMMRAKFMMNNKGVSKETREAHGAQYKSLGGITNALSSFLPGGLLGGMAGNTGEAQRNSYNTSVREARNARDAKAGAARAAGGFRGADANSRNLAGLQQMNVGQPYNPVADTGAAEAAEGVGIAASEYAGDKANIERQLYQDMVAADDKKLEIQKEQKEKAEEVNNEIEIWSIMARKYEDAITEYRIAASPGEGPEGLSAAEHWRRSGTRSEVIGNRFWQLMYSSWTDQGTIQGMIEDSQAYALDGPLESGWITQEQASANARFLTDTNELAAIALKAQGPGVKTDFDFRVAERGIANLKDNSFNVEAALVGNFNKAVATIERLEAKRVAILNNEAPVRNTFTPSTPTPRPGGTSTIKPNVQVVARGGKIKSRGDNLMSMKSKYYNNGKAVAYKADGGETQGNVEQTPVDFATDFEGTEYGFNFVGPASHEGNGPRDLDEFLPEDGAIQQGDLIASNDGFLYVLGGPQLAEGLMSGWYRSMGMYAGNTGGRGVTPGSGPGSPAAGSRGPGANAEAGDFINRYTNS